MADHDEPNESLNDGVREIAYGTGCALRNFIRSEKIERRDMASANPLQGFIAADDLLGHEHPLLVPLEPGRL